MTTKVTVEAHCDPKTTIVEVQVLDNSNDGQNIYIEDEDVVEFHVYDERQLIIKEIAK